MPFATDARRRSARALAAGVTALALAGCTGAESVQPFEPVTDPARLYLSLTLNHRAVNLSTTAPYDTIQLVGTPRNALRAPLSGLPAPTFRSSDTSKVVVSADGVVQAREPGEGVLVIAELRDSINTRHADTTVVNVTAEVISPVVHELSIQPGSPEDAVRSVVPWSAAFGLFLLQPIGIPVLSPIVARATDAGGGELSGLAIHYTSRDPEILQIDRQTGEIKPIRPGQAMIVATTSVYGVAKADSAVYTVADPFFQAIIIEADSGGTITVTPPSAALRPNGIVFFANVTTEAMDLVIEGPGPVEEAPAVCAAYGPSFCGTGNVETFGGDPRNLFASLRVRRFPTPGVYTYHSTLANVSGRIVVTEGPAVPSYGAPTP